MPLFMCKRAVIVKVRRMEPCIHTLCLYTRTVDNVGSETVVEASIFTAFPLSLLNLDGHYNATMVILGSRSWVEAQLYSVK